MTIVLCGGGSGGHITPLLAVAREIRALSPEARLVYLGERGGKFSHIAEESKLFDEYRYISAGKLRRYHGESLLTRITDVKTIALNIRDIFKLMSGCAQSYFLFRKLRPQAVLLKGGYVCVPASFGAKSVNSFIVTHDSDALPGLSNRIAARYAQVHATGMPTEFYNYPSETARYVGLPIDDRYREYSQDEIRFLKEKYGIPVSSRVILLTGGSNGAQRMNDWCLNVFNDLLLLEKDVYAFAVVGKGNLNQIDTITTSKIKKRVIGLEFTAELFHLAAIADVIITRAGATTLAEFAASKKACIIIPNPDLTGGHQLKNAKVYQEAEAAIVLQESVIQKDIGALHEAIARLLDDVKKRLELSDAIYATLPPLPAGKALAEILIQGINSGGQKS